MTAACVIGGYIGYKQNETAQLQRLKEYEITKKKQEEDFKKWHSQRNQSTTTNTTTTTISTNENINKSNKS